MFKSLAKAANLKNDLKERSHLLQLEKIWGISTPNFSNARDDFTFRVNFPTKSMA